MRYANIRRHPRDLWRVVDRDENPVPGELHEHFGAACGSAALMDVTAPEGAPYSVVAEQKPTWVRAA